MVHVAVAGYGIEGKASAAYWLAKGAQVTVLDEKEVLEVPAGVQVITGSEAFSSLGGYDFVVRTASLRPDKLSSARKIWSATNELFAECPAPIIGVTGTKGKGTTSSLITSILRAGGKTVHLVGNIGVPALEVLPTIQPDDVVVFEMSSFQLWDLEKSPQTAVVLMVEPDHLDVHTGMDEYVAAKSHIALYQSADDVVVCHSTNPYSRQIAAAGRAKKVYYGVSSSGGVYVQSNTFFIQNTPICSVDTLQLVGQHNVDNACAAMSAVLAYDPTTDFEALKTGLKSFTGLPHRLKFIRELDGVRYYDDNYSSAPGAAIAAIRSFTEPEIVILGGYDKKVDFGELAEAVAAQSNIKQLILMGQTRGRLSVALTAVGMADRYEVIDETTLESIVARARELAEPGDVVIMSPACASFDMFKNFSDRGDQFIKLVEELE